LFVGGIPPKIDRKPLKEYFEKFGEVEECRMMRDKVTKKFRGFAFITYKEAKVADMVLEINHKLQGHNVSTDLEFIF
jgi:RNA recognition motif-containing protein